MNDYRVPDGRLICADVFDGLALLEPESVQCVVTSPPYWGLRKYAGEQERVWGGDEGCEHEWSMPEQHDINGRRPELDGTGRDQGRAERSDQVTSGQFCHRCGAWRGAYGLEPTPGMWVEHTMDWLRAVRRVLRDDGTVWLNLGQCYQDEELVDLVAMLDPHWKPNGWKLRSKIVWAKPNPMPESVQGTRWEQHRVKIANRGRGREASRNTTENRPQQDHDGREFLPDSQWADCPGCAECSPNDGLILRHGSWRPTSSYEEILMLAKGPSYFADGEDVREQGAGTPWHPVGYAQTPQDGLVRAGFGNENERAGRNLRDVWTFPTQPFKGAHFATFAEELVRRCILSSTPEKVCSECGEPWARVLSTRPSAKDAPTDYQSDIPTDGYVKTNQGSIGGGHARQAWLDANPIQTLGFRPTCNHDAPARPAVVLDPFGGSGTVSVVARSLGRGHVYIDVSEEYREMARARLEATQPALEGGAYRE